MAKAEGHCFFVFLHVWVFCLHECLCVTVPGAHGCLKEVLNPLELELQLARSHHMDAGNGTSVLLEEQAMNALLNYQAISLVLDPFVKEKLGQGCSLLRKVLGQHTEAVSTVPSAR